MLLCWDIALTRLCVLCFLCFDERGIRYLSKHCAERYVMIGDLLAKEQYDVVLLQEVGGAACIQSLTHPHTHPLPLFHSF